ncbi:MAG: TlpA family protein disulfide reductase [Dehalococcoidia bacterium]|nr:TlpA family protein disulfide reductase [Dehalococcoidia bacterium]
MTALAGCGGREAEPTSDAAFQPEPVGSAESEAKLDPAKDFEISPYGGADFEGMDSVRLSDLLGRPIVLNFWAGLCPPCRAEMPDLQEFYDEYGDEIILLGVDVGPFTGLGSNQTGRGLIQALNITYPTGSTEDASVVTEYGVFSMPTTVFITADGKVFRKWSGIINKEKVVEIALDMLAPSSDGPGAATG